MNSRELASFDRRRSDSTCLPTGEVYANVSPSSPQLSPELLKIRKKGMFITLLSLFVAFLGFSIVNPLFPSYIGEFSDSAFHVGLVLGILAVTQFIFSPILGKISDKKGRRVVIILSLIGLNVCLILTGFATTVLHLTMVRALSGVFASLTSVCQAYLADVTLPAERSSYMGLAGASQGVALSLGPVIGGFVYHYFDFRTAALVGACFVFLALVIAIGWFENPPKIGAQNDEESQADSEEIERDWGAFKIVLLATFFNWIMISNMQSIVPLTLLYVLNGSTLHYSFMMAFSGLTIVIFQWKLIKKFVALFNSEAKAAAFATFVSCLIAIIISLLEFFSFNVFIMFILFIPLSMTKAAIMSCSSALCSFWADNSNKGKIMGILMSISALGRTTPIFMTILFDIQPKLPWVFTTFLLILACLMYLFTADKLPKKREKEEKHDSENSEVELEIDLDEISDNQEDPCSPVETYLNSDSSMTSC
ncbi:hypothetical protein P9112_005419 [Eukaryota sp. TZLM1-RC]